jgi:hypothetical protein
MLCSEILQTLAKICRDLRDMQKSTAVAEAYREVETLLMREAEVARRETR